MGYINKGEEQIPPKVLVTGAGGFVGGHLVQYLSDAGYKVVSGKRKITKYEQESIKLNLDQSPVLDKECLQGIEVVIHTAAIAEVDENNKQSVKLCEKVNTKGTVELAKLAAEAGVKRFIFISSLKVNGESTADGDAFRADSVPEPQGIYALSKANAENALRSLAQSTGMEVVIIRPPLVYGQGVEGNFKRLISLINKGLPLPLGAIKNKRSMVYIGNLCSLVERVIEVPAAANQIFLVSDDDDISTTELLRLLKVASGSKVFLLPVPEIILRLLFQLLNKTHISERVLGSLCVDISETINLLDWKPPYSVKEAIHETLPTR